MINLLIVFMKTQKIKKLKIYISRTRTTPDSQYIMYSMCMCIYVAAYVL